MSINSLVYAHHSIPESQFGSLWFGAVKQSGSSVWRLSGTCDSLPETVIGTLYDVTQCASLVIDEATFYLKAIDCNGLLPFVCVHRKGKLYNSITFNKIELNRKTIYVTHVI